MKKLLAILICFFSFLLLMTGIKADETKEKVNVYIFTKDGCSHCQQAEKYFAELSADKEYGEMFNLITLEVFDGEWNIVSQEFYDLLMKITKKMGDKFGGTPYIIIGEKSLDVFGTKYDEDIKKEIKRCFEEGYEDPIANIDKKQTESDPYKGMKIFFNIALITVTISLVVGFIISRIPKRKMVTDTKKTNHLVKEKTKVTENKEAKHTPKEERVQHNAPKTKSSNKQK